MNQPHNIEPYWQEENDWLCTVEFLPSNAPEDRALAADKIELYWIVIGAVARLIGVDTEALAVVVMAHYRAQRAERQYEATDPENRLVAHELERRWNAALEAARERTPSQNVWLGFPNG